MPRPTCSPRGSRPTRWPVRPYSAERVAAVAAERAPAYRAADARIDATRDPQVVASEVLERLAAPRAAGWRMFDADLPRHHPVGPDTARVVMGVDLDRATIAGAVPTA